jgi:YD repeat-containing protein
MGLTFVRYYNSRYSCEGSATCTANAGAWTTNLDYRLLVTCALPPAPTTTTDAITPDQLPGGGEPIPCHPADYYRPDGSMLVFPSTSTFYGTPGATVDIPGPFNGAGTATLTNNGNGTYTVHDEDARNLTFNAAGILQSITDASGISWTLTYPDANTVVVTHTNGQSFTLQRNSTPTTYGAAKQITVTDPAGNVYIYQSTVGASDAWTGPVSQIGVIDSVTLPGSPSTVVGYQYFADNASTYTYAQLKEVDYNGVAHDVTTYDSSGRANMSSLADGNEKTSVVYGSNSTGPTATVTNPLGHVSVYQYNSSQLLVSVTGDASTHCAASFAQDSYDANGNLLTSTDNNGNVTAYTYDAAGLLQQKVEAQGSAVQRTTDIAWDTTAGTVRPLSVTIEGYAKTAYTYDAHNRLASVAVTNLTGNGTANQTLTTSYSYVLYSNGLVQTRTVVHPSPSNSDTDVYTYDAQGRLTSVANGLGQTTTYGNYNALGEPGKIVGPNGDETDYTYDARGRVQAKTTHPNGGTATWTYAYDGFGLLASQTEPDGVVTQWNRDADMRVDTITHTEKDGNSTETIGYDANGDVTRRVITRGSVTALSESMQYDELGRLIEKDGSNGQKQTYQYDLDGNVLSTTNALGHTVAYQYDALNRVQKVTESGGASLGVPTLGVPASSANGSYTVSWSAMGDATSYTLQEQVNGGAWSTIYTGANTSTALSGKSDGTYSYQVQACNAGSCGGWSAAASISVLLPPPAPASLSAPATSGASVAVGWPSAGTATSYTLQQAIGGGAWSTIYSGAALAYTATETATGTYTFRVQACNASGCGAYVTSSAVTVTLPPGTAPSLSVPAANGTGSYTVSWGTVSTATSYNLQKQTNGGGWSTVYSGSATSTVPGGNAWGATYGFRVQACNVSGCGPWSAVGTVVLVPAPPSSITVPSSGLWPGTVTIPWTASSGATSYNLEVISVATGVAATIYTGAATSYTAAVSVGQVDYAANACNAAGCSGWTTGGPMTSVASGCPAGTSAVKAGTVNPLSIKCPPTVPAAVQGGTP